MAKFSMGIKIFPFDTDLNGHVSNITYIRWLEMARTEMMIDTGLTLEQMVERGLGVALTNTEIHYRKPLLVEDDVMLYMWISDLGRASAWMDFQIFGNDNKLSADGRQRGLFIDRTTQMPYRIGSDMRDAYKKFLINA